MDVDSPDCDRQVSAKPKGQFRDYISLGRLDHSTKHIFIVPGIVLAYLLRGGPTHIPVLEICLGLFTAICIASANYVINEYLDREFDKYHPTKSHRRAVECDLRGSLVFLEWCILVLVGLCCAWFGSVT